MTDMDMPLPEPDAEILKLAREHAPVIYTNRHFPDAPAFSFPSSKLIAFARAYAAAEVAKERERIAALERLVIDAAYTLDKARTWNGMGWTYNPLHPVHYAPMRERLHNECNNIEAIRAAAIRAGSAKS